MPGAKFALPRRPDWTTDKKAGQYWLGFVYVLRAAATVSGTQALIQYMTGAGELLLVQQVFQLHPMYMVTCLPRNSCSMIQSAPPLFRNDRENKFVVLIPPRKHGRTVAPGILSNITRLATIDGAALNSISSAVGQKFPLLVELAEPKATSAVAVLRSRLRYKAVLLIILELDTTPDVLGVIKLIFTEKFLKLEVLKASCG